MKRQNLLLVIVLLLTCVAVAEDGRDFAGLYDTANVADLGTQVGLTLRLQVFNYSGADVNNATITLLDSTDPTIRYGFFDGVSVVYRSEVRLTGNFTVSKAEFDSWQKSGNPNLLVEFFDASGNPVQRGIEIMWSSLPEEE